MKKIYSFILLTFLTACSSATQFGTGVNITFDPRTIGMQIDDTIMQKNLSARLALTDKKYFISRKDIMLIESIKSDGIKISKKYDDIYEINESEIPSDIQVMINNNEIGSTLLRIIEVIGQDELEALDEDTLYFIVSALNQLNIDYIRNKILLKILPLKV